VDVLSNSKLSKKVRNIRSSGIRELFDLAQRTEDVINLGIGEPDFVTPTHISEAAKQALDEGYTHYTPNAGFLDLRQAIAEKLKQENYINVEPEKEIVVTVGGAGAVLLAVHALVDAGDEVLIPDPCFVTYEPCVTLAGGKIVTVPLREGDFRLLPEEVEKRIGIRTKCIILNSPMNPTGSVMTEADIRAIADIALRHNLFILSDEVYEKLIYEDAKHFSPASIPDMKHRVVTINSFSKTYAMTGWRIGYVVADADICSAMIKIQQNTVANAPAIAQRAALAALRGPQDCVRAMVKEYDQRRRFLIKRLNRITEFCCQAPKGAFYAFPSVKALGCSALEFAQNLLKKGKVVTVPGGAFGKRGESHIRLCYAVPIEKLKIALDRIEDTVGQEGL